MTQLSRALFVTGIALWLCACGIGFARTSSAHTPLIAVTETTAILGDEVDAQGNKVKPSGSTKGGMHFYELLGFKDHSWGNYTRGYVGIHAATLIGRVRGSPSNAPASSGWMLTQHLTGVLGLGAYALQIDWQQRTEDFDYDRGFGGEMVSKGVVVWLGYSPVGSVGVSLGYGRPNATLSMGSLDNRSLWGIVDATAAFYGLAIDTFVAGGGIGQWGIRPRLVIGYTSVDADMPLPNLPTSYSGASAGLEVVGTVF